MTPAEFQSIRLAAGLTPEALCERLRLARGASAVRYVRMLERGDRRVSGPVSLLMHQIASDNPMERAASVVDIYADTYRDHGEERLERFARGIAATIRSTEWPI